MHPFPAGLFRRRVLVFHRDIYEWSWIKVTISSCQFRESVAADLVGAFSILCHRCSFFKMHLPAASDCSHILGKASSCYRTLFKFRDDVFFFLIVFGIQEALVAVELKGWFIYFGHFRVIAVWLHAGEVLLLPYQVGVGSTWRSAICCSYHVSVFYSFLLPTLDVFQWLCDITRLSTIIRCFFQVNIICLGKHAHTHRHTHTQTPHFASFFF